MATTINPSNQTITQYTVQVGGANNLLASVGPGSAGQIFQSGGNAANPVYSTATYPATATGTGKVLVADGTNWVASTPTFPNASATSGKIIQSDGTNWVASTPTYPTTAGTSGKILISDGTNIVSSTPTYPNSASGTGTILRADGTNWVATTSTYPNTNAVNTLLYASSANVMAALATANSGVLTTDASGVPSIDTTNFVRQTTGMQMKGNNTNTAPPAGFIGEQIRSFVNSGSAVTMSHTVTTNITSISLTAGIWDVSGIVNYHATNTNTTNPSTITSIVSTSATTGNSGDNAVQGTMPSTSGTVNTATDLAYTIPNYRVLLSSTTTYYLTAYTQATVTFGCTAWGRLSATRVG